MFKYIICIAAEREIFNHNSQRKEPSVYKGKEIEQRNSEGLIQFSQKILRFVRKKENHSSDFTTDLVGRF